MGVLGDELLTAEVGLAGVEDITVQMSIPINTAAQDRQSVGYYQHGTGK
jgi:hypothetical protein